MVKQTESKIKEKIKSGLENLILPGIALVSGGIVGTFDILTSGMPIFSGITEASYLSKVVAGTLFASDWGCDSKEILGVGLLGNFSYVAGAATPFVIKYHNEIYEFTKNAIDFIKW